MALAWRSASPSTSTLTQGSGTSTIVLSQPAGLQTDDVLLAIIQDPFNGSTPTTAPTGWTNKGVVHNAGHPRLQVFTAVVGQNSLPAGPWTFTGFAGSNASAGCVHAFSGGSNDFANQPDVAISGRANAAGASGTTTITPANNNDTVVAIFSHDGASICTWTSEAVATAPGLTERSDADLFVNSVIHYSIALAEGTLATAAPTGASSATQSATSNNYGILLSFKPASAVNGTATPAGVSAAGAVNTAIGEPVALPSGVSAASAVNSPNSGVAALPAGVTAASSVNSPLGNVHATPSGVTAASAVHAPFATAAQLILTSDASTHPFGTPFLLTATVVNSGFTNGFVVFKEGTTILGGSTLVAGVATLSVTLPIGEHLITAIATLSASGAVTTWLTLIQGPATGDGTINSAAYHGLPNESAAPVGTVFSFTVTGSGVVAFAFTPTSTPTNAVQIGETSDGILIYAFRPAGVNDLADWFPPPPGHSENGETITSAYGYITLSLTAQNTLTLTVTTAQSIADGAKSYGSHSTTKAIKTHNQKYWFNEEQQRKLRHK